jgi:hypothetical protein
MFNYEIMSVQFERPCPVYDGFLKLSSMDSEPWSPRTMGECMRFRCVSCGVTQKRMECDRGGSTEHCARLRLALIDVAGDRDSPGMTENCFGFAAVGSRWCRAESRSSDLENGQSGHRAIRSSASGRAERRVCTSAQSPRVVSTISRCASRTEADGRSALLGLRTRLLTDLRQFFLF